MIERNYKQYKKQVLSIYDEFVDMCRKTGKNVDGSIERQAQKIKDEVFNLMILGEAKSGKSTFINAYLGMEVVPMDVRQCTSAIIKIKRGNNNEFTLIAKAAGGGETRRSGAEEIRNFLKEHAAISDKYRSIPVTTINHEILIKYKGKEIPQKILDGFIKEEMKDNIFNLNENEYSKLIKEYIRENQQKWGKIITEIEIIYPLPEEMQGITIIDSPGVGAGGNVGKIAEDYINQANAIIFVKSLSGQALESSSFMNFMRNNCTNKTKECLFLVFTGKANLQGYEFERLREQAIAMYKNDIAEEKIICVDSKMQLFLNQCRELETAEKIDEFFDECYDNDEEFTPAYSCWRHSKSVEHFYDNMEIKSNFLSVQNAMEKFARQANYIQLIEFLDNLIAEYQRFYALYSDMLATTQETASDPQAFAEKIMQKKREIDDVYNRMDKGVSNIRMKYLDPISGEGIILKEAEEKKQEYLTQIQEFCNLSESAITDDTFLRMRTMTMDAIDDSKDFREEIAKRVIEECNDALIAITDAPSMIQAEAYSPNFTEADFDKLNETAKEETSGYHEIEHGFTFKSIEKVPYHRLKDHVRIVADSISNRLEEIVDTMLTNAVAYANSTLDMYTEKLSEHRDELQSEYQKLEEDKENNEKILETVAQLEQKVDMLAQGIEHINTLKGELENYVN